jgi:tetratricopeptide (TPR) repeat protein
MKGARRAGADPELVRLLAVAGEALRRGDFAAVEDAGGRALQRAPDHAEALNLLGTAALARGRGAEAVALLEKAVARAPKAAMVRCNLAFAYRLAGRIDAAAGAAEEATRLDATLTPAFTVLGTALKELGRPQQAIAPLRRALELSPGLARAVLALGEALSTLGRVDEATRLYEDAVARTPGFSDAWSGLGWIHVEARRYADAARCFRKALATRRASPWWPGDAAAVPPRPTTPANLLKLDHDIEQLAWLRDHGLLPAAVDIEAYRGVRERVAAAHGAAANLVLSPQELGPIADSFARIVHWRETPMQTGPVLGEFDRAAIETRYAAPPGVCWVDGLLTPRALEELRRFCLDSTIWNDIAHNFRDGEVPRAYLGTYAGDGFCCPLLFQVAEELTRALPAIFRDHRLQQMWAYKYEEHAEGIALHGDDAAVNVNFWITPDAANLDPQSGGLIVYPVEAPADWSFADINKHPDRIARFLAGSGVTPVEVPYRQNRGVIFNSDLFHATAPLKFKPGYESRRINVTMLFGRRAAGGDEAIRAE